MAASSLLALIDDIASALDDVAAMTKVATKKTAGVLGDDLALNAQQVAGVSADRELPIVFAVAKGSAVNKVILVPLALIISQVLPWLVTPLLMAGGLFLCFEGFEKVFEKIIPHKDENAQPSSKEDLKNLTSHDFEKQKVKGAVRTDFILSAEIVVITLGTVATESLVRQFAVLCGISAIMTVGVYGLVAAIVKIDDLGLYMSLETKPHLARVMGGFILKTAPLLMRFLGVAGTIAMFLVGGGILVHGIPFLHQIESSQGALGVGVLGLVTGLVSGGLVFALFLTFKKVTGRFN